MKKLLLSTLVLFFTVNLAVAQSNSDILPEEAKTFIKENFASAAIEKADKEDGMLSMDKSEAYEVHLSSGIKLDFDAEGKVTEIESQNGSELPESVIPAEILSYIQENHAGTGVTSWEMDNDEQEVELADGTDLEFDKNGKFLKED
ncbi:MAG TPA: PepSY-like domain-containing protein [Salinimicrobium sp.]|nr:PepSY-like domain-containing protein [Salinimicrobium sp.]